MLGVICNTYAVVLYVFARVRVYLCVRAYVCVSMRIYMPEDQAKVNIFIGEGENEGGDVKLDQTMTQDITLQRRNTGQHKS